MPWNQPGSGGQDPWKKPSGQGGPPDLDEIVRNVQKRLGGLFGGSGGNGSSPTGSSFLPGGIGVGVIAILVGVVWLLTGFYKVDAGDAGVVLQFGKYSETTGPGLRWHWPYPIETAHVIDIQKINTVEVGYRKTNQGTQGGSVPREALMLTADENIVDLQFAVQYDIKDPKDLLFKVSDTPEVVVRGATESAVREIVGRSEMDFVLTEGRGEVVTKVKVLLQQVLDRYETGINIKSVEMQDAQPPAQVKAAFDDVVKAREDRERLKNEAEAYANDILPRARGLSARITQEAEAYKASVIARSEGEAARFSKVLAEYEKAPAITRTRLYLEAMESVLANSSKLLIDQKGGNNVIYLPLDQLMRQRSQSATPQSSASNSPPAMTETAPPRRSSDPRGSSRPDSRRGRF